MTGHFPVGSCVKPTINLPTGDGSTWSLAERAGRTIVLIFHRHIH
jgi:hypothetical protein